MKYTSSFNLFCNCNTLLPVDHSILRNLPVLLWKSLSTSNQASFKNWKKLTLNSTFIYSINQHSLGSIFLFKKGLERALKGRRHGKVDISSICFNVTKILCNSIKWEWSFEINHWLYVPFFSLNIGLIMSLKYLLRKWSHI